jgi:hypothetical protein
MNEQIKELAEQSFDIIKDNRGRVDYSADSYGIEKFAELIVRECTNICEELGDKGLDGHYCVDKIKEHFGIQK